MKESLRVTASIFPFGSAVKSVSSLDAESFVERTFRSVTSILVPVVGSLPSQMPVTVVTPEITMLVSATD